MQKLSNEMEARLSKKFAYVSMTALCFFVGGYGLMKAWEWFVVPRFWVNHMTFPEAMGFFTLIQFLMYRNYLNLDAEDYWDAYQPLAGVLFLLMLLFWMWFFHVVS